MQERSPAVYDKADLSDYSVKQRFLIRLADIVFYALISIVGVTLRYRVEGEEHRTAISEAGKTPIYALWHDRIFAGTYFLRGLGLVVLTSKSFDGEYIARFLTRFGFGTVRGSSSRGGVRGLVEMIKLMRHGLPMAFTLDGPRGPRHIAKSGAIVLAKKTGNPLLPFITLPRNFYTVSSWDRLQIPYPFTKVSVVFGEPISISPDADDSDIEDSRKLLQKVLDELEERAKQ